MPIKRQNMTTYLITSWILNIPKGDHIMVVGEGLIKMGKDLRLVGIQEGSIPQLMRSMGANEGARGRMISWHCDKSKWVK